MQSPTPHKLATEVPDCHPGTLELEAEGSEVQGHAQLYRGFEASLSYLRPLVNKQETKVNKSK